MPYKRLIIQVRLYVVGVIHELPPEVWPKRAIRELPLQSTNCHPDLVSGSIFTGFLNTFMIEPLPAKAGRFLLRLKVDYFG